MQNPEVTLCVEIPRCPVFAQGAVVKKRKRKKSKLSLTDCSELSFCVSSNSTN
jgi:hypothetical protein